MVALNCGRWEKGKTGLSAANEVLDIVLKVFKCITHAYNQHKQFKLYKTEEGKVLLHLAT